MVTDEHLMTFIKSRKKTSESYTYCSLIISISKSKNAVVQKSTVLGTAAVISSCHSRLIRWRRQGHRKDVERDACGDEGICGGRRGDGGMEEDVEETEREREREREK